MLFTVLWVETKGSGFVATRFQHLVIKLAQEFVRRATARRETARRATARRETAALQVRSTAFNPTQNVPKRRQQFGLSVVEAPRQQVGVRIRPNT